MGAREGIILPSFVVTQLSVQALQVRFVHGNTEEKNWNTPLEYFRATCTKT